MVTVQAAAVQPKVTVQTYWRDKDCEPYELRLTQSHIEIDDLTVTIGWWFPGGDSSLDKVVIDGEVFEGDRLEAARGTDTAVKEGSVVQGFKTAFPDDSD